MGRPQKKPYLLCLEESLNIPGNMYSGIVLLDYSIRNAQKEGYAFCLYNFPDILVTVQITLNMNNTEWHPIPPCLAFRQYDIG